MALNRRTTIPWLIVAIVSLVAIIAAIVVVGLGRMSTGTTTTATTSSTSSATAAAPTDAATTGTDSATTSTSASASESTSASASATTASGTSTLAIDAWKVKLTVSNKLGNTGFTLSNGVLTFTSNMEKALPSSCSDLVGSWGITRSTTAPDDTASAITINGKYYSFFSANESCSSAPSDVTTITNLYQKAFNTLTAQ